MEWLSYLPGRLIQERENLKTAYEIAMPALGIEVGRVEAYFSPAHDYKVRWRTLDHWKCDWQQGWLRREDAAQDLVANCPRTVEFIKLRRERLALVARAAQG